MEKYNAWIKELSTIVYDNSKSEYQILSELIPILLNIKSSQDTNSEFMDTIHETVFNKVNELESGMNTFTETFIGKLNEFKQEFTPQLEEFTTTLESNIKEFKEKINNKISSFNTTYASEKASIQDIADSINNINDTLVSGYNEILDKINNFVEPIINSASENIINTGIEEKFTPQYLARESIYIDLVSVTTEPSSANEGDIYYNASEYQLYKYTSGAWVEEEYTLNKLYRYQSNLYRLSMIKTDATLIGNLNQSMMVKGKEGYFVGMPGNGGIKIVFNICNINGGIQQIKPEVFPDNYTDSSAVYKILYSSNDNKYYFAYRGETKEEQPNAHYFIGSTADDFSNLMFETYFPTPDTLSVEWLKVINGYMYWNNYKYINGNWEKIPYRVIGYADNKYWAIDNKAIYYASDDTFTDAVKYVDVRFSTSTAMDNDFYYKNDILIAGGFIIINKQAVGKTANDSTLLYNDICTFDRDFIYTRNKSILATSYIDDSRPMLTYDETYTVESFVNTYSTYRYIIKLGLVPYE